MIVESRPKPVTAIVAVLIALVLSGLLALAAGAPLGEAYQLLIVDPFESSYTIGVTLNNALPLVLVALSFIVSARCGELNIGIPGQLYMGALASTVVATTLSLPGFVHLPLAVLAAAVAGAAWALLPALLKAWRNVNQLVTALLLNYVAIEFVNYMVAQPLRAPGRTYAESEPIPESATFPLLITGTTLRAGVLVALVVAVIVYLLFRYTALGFEMRSVGANPRAARFVGIDVKRTALVGFVLSGAIGGLAGGVQILSTDLRLVENFAPEWGYSGIMVALLGGLSPLGAIFAGAFFGLVENGADGLQRAVGTPAALSLIIQGTAVLTYLAAGGMTQARALWGAATAGLRTRTAVRESETTGG